MGKSGSEKTVVSSGARMAACAPVAVLWLFSGAALAALGQQPEIATMAGRYLALCIPCLFMGTAIEV